MSGGSRILRILKPGVLILLGVCLTAPLRAEPLGGGQTSVQEVRHNRASKVLEGDISLQQAWLIAQQHDDLTVGARREVARAKSLYRQLSDQFSPDISWRTGVNRSEAEVDNELATLDQTDVNEHTEYTQLQVVLPWGTKRGLTKDIEKAALDVDVAKAKYRNSLRDLHLRLATSYYEVVLHEEKRTAAHTSLEAVEARLRLAQEEFKLGGRSAIDVLSEEANLLSNRSSAELATYNLQEKQRALFALLKVSPLSRVKLTDRLKYERFIPESLSMKDILVNRTRAEQFIVDKQEIEIEKAGQQWFPRIGFNAGYRWFDSEESNGNRTSKGAYYGAFVEVPFPTEGTTHAVRVAQLDLAAAEFDLQQAEDRQRNRIVELLRRVNQVEGRVLLLQDLLRAKQREVEAHRASYELGKLTALDMNLVVSSVVDIEQQYYDSLFDCTMVVFELKNLGDMEIQDASTTGSP